MSVLKASGADTVPGASAVSGEVGTTPVSAPSARRTEKPRTPSSNPKSSSMDDDHMMVSSATS